MNPRSWVFIALATCLVMVVPPTIATGSATSAASYLWFALLALLLLAMSRWRQVQLALPALLILVVPMLSTLLAPRPTGGTLLGAIIPLIGGTVGYVLLRGGMDRVIGKRLLRLLLLLSVPLAALAAAQYVTQSWPILDQISVAEFRSDAFERRSAATFGHPIMYGTFAGAMIIVALTQRRWWRWPVILLNVAGLLATGSRSALLPVGALLGLWVLSRAVTVIRQQRIMKGTLLNTFILALALYSFGAALNLGVLEISDRYADAGSSFSATYRVRQWGAGWQIISSSAHTLWLGHGAGAATDLLQHRFLINVWGPRTFDNAYITLLFDYGLVGLTGVIALLSWGVVTARNSVARLMILFLALNAFFFDAFLWPAWMFLLIIGFALRGYEPSSFERVTRR